MSSLPTVDQKRDAVFNLLMRGRVNLDVASILWYIAHNDKLLERIHFVDTLIFCTDVMIIGEQGTQIPYYMAFDLALRQQVFEALMHNQPIVPNIKDLLEAEVIQQSIPSELAIWALKRHRRYIYAQFNYQNDQFPSVYQQVVLANPYVLQLNDTARKRTHEIFGTSHSEKQAHDVHTGAQIVHTTAIASSSKQIKTKRHASQMAAKEQDKKPVKTSLVGVPKVDYYILLAQMKHALNDMLLRHEIDRAKGLYDAIKIIENFMRQYNP